MTYYAALVRISSHLTGRTDVAEDIVQDLFVHLWEQNKEIDFSKPFPYLRKATIMRTFNWIKREKQIELSDVPENSVITNFESNIEGLDSNERLTALKLAIELLPTKCRLIFRLNRFEGLTTTEIAEYLSLSPNTVENQIGKALKLLRNQFRSAR